MKEFHIFTFPHSHISTFPHLPMRIFLIGFMGSGKTYWGRQLGQKLGIPFFDLDEQVVNHAGKSIPDIFQQEGEEHFRLLEKEVMYMITESHESFVMSCGGGKIGRASCGERV